MPSYIVNPGKPLPSVRIACIATLTLILSGWTACSAIVAFNGCEGSIPQPKITALSPRTIPGNAESVPLMVSGSGFTSQSQIMWNGSALQTTFSDPRHLQTTITQQTLDSLGGGAGSMVQISVMSPGSGAVAGCPNGGSSASLVLVIN